MLYPIVVELGGREVLVVGGGSVAERKVRRLMEAEARVTVIALEANDKLRKWGDAGRIDLRIGAFDADELGAPELVFAATDEPGVNDAVVRAARERGIFANSAAGADLDFVVPAIGRADGIGLAVWSGNPALSQRLRDELLGHIDPRWSLAGRIFDTLRITLAGRGTATERGAFWRNLAAGVPAEFRTVAVAKRFVRAVGDSAKLPLGRAESDALFEVADD